VDYETARKQTLEREQIQRDRYKRYYGIDIDDLSLYNLVIDTGNRTVESTAKELMTRIRKTILQRGKE
jgi:cytidylate kinase